MFALYRERRHAETIKILEQYIRGNRFKVNMEKTEIMVFKNGRKMDNKKRMEMAM